MTLLHGLRLSSYAPLQAAQERVFCDTCKSGPPAVARHVIRCRLTQQTRVQNACRVDEVASLGPGRYRTSVDTPRVLLNLRDGGSKRVSMIS